MQLRAGLGGSVAGADVQSVTLHTTLGDLKVCFPSLKHISETSCIVDHLTKLLRLSAGPRRPPEAPPSSHRQANTQIEVFCEPTPRAAENFLAHCAAGTYNNTLFHRNIKTFMVQGGDPTGTGKGGQSIWGAPFKDEIRSTLKFNQRGVVACANAGPDTNKAQVSCRVECRGSGQGRRS